MTISTRPSMICSVEEFKQNVQPGTGRKTFSVLLVRASAKPIFRAEPDLPEGLRCGDLSPRRSVKISRSAASRTGAKLLGAVSLAHLPLEASLFAETPDLKDIAQFLAQCRR